jgi:hypothetical protein
VACNKDTKKYNEVLERLHDVGLDGEKSEEDQLKIFPLLLSEEFENLGEAWEAFRCQIEIEIMDEQYEQTASQKSWGDKEDFGQWKEGNERIQGKTKDTCLWNQVRNGRFQSITKYVTEYAGLNFVPTNGELEQWRSHWQQVLLRREESSKCIFLDDYGNSIKYKCPGSCGNSNRCTKKINPYKSANKWQQFSLWIFDHEIRKEIICQAMKSIVDEGKELDRHSCMELLYGLNINIKIRCDPCNHIGRNDHNDSQDLEGLKTQLAKKQLKKKKGG